MARYQSGAVQDRVYNDLVTARTTVDGRVLGRPFGQNSVGRPPARAPDDRIHEPVAFTKYHLQQRMAVVNAYSAAIRTAAAGARYMPGTQVAGEKLPVGVQQGYLVVYSRPATWKKTGSNHPQVTVKTNMANTPDTEEIRVAGVVFTAKNGERTLETLQNMFSLQVAGTFELVHTGLIPILPGDVLYAAGIASVDNGGGSHVSRVDVSGVDRAHIPVAIEPVHSQYNKHTSIFHVALSGLKQQGIPGLSKSMDALNEICTMIINLRAGEDVPEDRLKRHSPAAWHLYHSNPLPGQPGGLVAILAAVQVAINDLEHHRVGRALNPTESAGLVHILRQ